jgi:ribosomal protein S18 acetylase RimI-like enzyme
MDFVVTRATNEDADELSALVNSAYRGESSKAGWTTEADLLGGQRTSAELLRGDLANAESRILCLREAPAGPILACVFLQRQSDDSKACYLGLLTVKPNLQTRGMGKYLMQEAERYAQNWGAERMVLSVIQLRESLMAWYERRGYKKTGHSRPFPYGDLQFGHPKRDDLYFVIFEKSLNA